MTAGTEHAIPGHGFKEFEASAPIDPLRRAGVEYTNAWCELERMVQERCSIRIEADDRT